MGWGFARRGYRWAAARAAIWLAPLGSRMALLLLIALVPTLLMAGEIDWRSYQDRDAGMLDRARVERDEAVGRAEANLETTRQLLTTLSLSSPVLDPNVAGCHELTVQLMQMRGEPFVSFGVTDGQGTVLCTSRRTADQLKISPVLSASRSWFQRVSQRRQFSLGDSEIGLLSRVPIILAALPVMRNGVMWRTVFASLRISALAAPGQNLAGWILSSTGETLAQGSDAQLPNEQYLAAVRASTGRMTFSALGRDGRNYAYASAALSGDAHLLLANPEQVSDLRKLRAFFIRIVAMGLLLLAAAAAVAYGAILLVTRPLQRLRDEVRAYAPGGTFAPADLSMAAIEVQQLASAFAKTTERLAEHEKRQELLMLEIHHRVKNNLQVVASLLNLQASRLRQPEARAEFQSARDRVQALATLHRHLISQGDASVVEMGAFLVELAHQIFSAMGETGPDEANGGRIGMAIDADLPLPPDQAVPVALVVTEAVSNALKYAFPDQRTGAIQVSLRRGSDGIRLEIADDGCGGLSAEPTSHGLGLRLIQGFARQLGGRLVISSGEGTRIVIEGIGENWRA